MTEQEKEAQPARLCGCSPGVYCEENSDDGVHCGDCGERCDSFGHEEQRGE